MFIANSEALSFVVSFPDCGSGLSTMVQRNKLVAKHVQELTAENLSMSF